MARGNKLNSASKTNATQLKLDISSDHNKLSIKIPWPAMVAYLSVKNIVCVFSAVAEHSACITSMHNILVTGIRFHQPRPKVSLHTETYTRVNICTALQVLLAIQSGFISLQDEQTIIAARFSSSFHF